MNGLRKRVLIVEDDPGAQLLLRNMLLHIDPQIRVTTTATAEAAMLALNEAQWDGGMREFDLVVADINLPGSNGLLLWKVAMKRFTLEFLFISSMPREKWEEQSVAWVRANGEMNVPRFLEKPITIEKLKGFWYPMRVNHRA